MQEKNSQIIEKNNIEELSRDEDLLLNPDFLAARESGSERLLIKRGVLSREDGLDIYDFNRARHIKKKDSVGGFFYKGKTYYLNRLDTLNYLVNKKGVAKDDDLKVEKPCISLPESIFAAKNGIFEDGLALPWDIDVAPNFKGTVTLSSGEAVGLADLFYLKLINKLRIHRNEKNELVYYDTEDESFKKFTGKVMEDMVNVSVSFLKKDGHLISFSDDPLSFINKFLPLVESLELFKPSDFKRRKGAKQAETLFSHDRKFNQKNPFINTSGEEGLVRYYIGRKKIVGTDKEIDDNLLARELDKNTVGIIEKKYNKTRLLYTFNKFNKQEYEEHGFNEVGDTFRTVPAKEMKERLNAYKLSDYLPQHIGESSTNYADRLSHLNDIEYISQDFRIMLAATGVSLQNLSWKEQILVANYILETDDEKEMLDYISNFGEVGLRSFLAVEIDAQSGNKLIALSKKLPEDTTRLVLNKISALNTLAIKKSEELSQLFYGTSPIKSEKEKNNLLGSIHNYLFSKSEEIINSFSNDKSAETMLADLDRFQAEMLMLAGVLQEAKRTQVDPDIEEIKDLKLHIKDFGEQMDPTDVKEILEIARVNWQEFGNENMKEIVISGLENALSDTSNQRCYTLKYKEQVIGFVRFEKTDHNTLYAGSFNVSKDLRGLSIGTEMMEQALVKEAENNTLEATASIKIPATSAYIEKVGFVANGLIKNYHGSGEDMFNIILDKKQNKYYRVRDDGKETMFKKEELASLALPLARLSKRLGDPVIILRFNLKTEMKDYQTALNILLPQKDETGRSLNQEKDYNYSLTRFFSDEAKDQHEKILIFEKN